MNTPGGDEWDYEPESIPDSVRFFLAEEEGFEPRGRYRPAPTPGPGTAPTSAGQRGQIPGLPRAATLDELGIPGCIDWDALFAGNAADPEWLVEPLIPAGGRALLFAAHPKAMKSMLAFWVALGIATGRRILDGGTTSTARVIYLDAEMSEADVGDRVRDLGYGPEHAEALKANLCYLLGPRRPLDTADGAADLLAAVAAWQPGLVVIDTWRRLNQGDENDANSINAFYALTIAPLKDAGVTTITLHHSGKDDARGARGSSDFNAWPDVVYSLARGDGSLRLRATHSRIPWVPKELALRIDEDPLSFDVSADVDGWAAAAVELADQLTAWRVPEEAGRDAVRKAMADRGVKARNAVIGEALRFRRARSRELNSTPKTEF